MNYNKNTHIAYLLSWLVFWLILGVSLIYNNFVTIYTEYFILSVPVGIYAYFLIDFMVIYKLERKNDNDKYKVSSLNIVLYVLGILILPIFFKGKLNLSVFLTVMFGLIVEFIYPGIVEEFFFRKIFIEILKKYISSKNMIILIQAIVFSMSHMLININFVINPQGLLPLFILAYVLGEIYYKTDSIKLIVLIHASYNFIMKNIQIYIT